MPPYQTIPHQNTIPSQYEHKIGYLTLTYHTTTQDTTLCHHTNYTTPKQYISITIPIYSRLSHTNTPYYDTEYNTFLHHTILGNDVHNWKTNLFDKK